MSRLRRALPDLLALLGFALVSLGAGAVYPPAGLLVAGALLIRMSREA